MKRFAVCCAFVTAVFVWSSSQPGFFGRRLSLLGFRVSEGLANFGFRGRTAPVAARPGYRPNLQEANLVEPRK
jgi:hypothetical protein